MCANFNNFACLIRHWRELVRMDELMHLSTQGDQEAAQEIRKRILGLPECHKLIPAKSPLESHLGRDIPASKETTAAGASLDGLEIRAAVLFFRGGF